jgi:glycosyltransferase involved in cell wall biosynthesis
LTRSVDLRWFAPSRLFALVVDRLRQLGLSIALEGDGPARLAIAMDAQVAEQAYRYAATRRRPLIQYVWDLPPWKIGTGRHDWIWFVLGRYVRLPRLGRRYPQRRGYFSRLRYVAAHAREVWVPSAMTAQSVQERFGLSCRQVPYCYDSDRFRPAAPPATRSGPLLSVSRLVSYKNQAAVIRAAARFEPRLSVRIIGNGLERESLERLAHTLGVSCSVETGLDDQAVLAAYRSAGIVVCPSRFEGLGLSPIEGIACGIPVVASDIPPHREFLGHAAYFFSLDDDDSLVAAIAAARQGGPPRRDVLRDLTIEAAAQRFLDLLTPHLR